MMKRRKLPSKVALVVALIAAVAGVLSRNKNQPGQISLPSQSKPAPIETGKARVVKIIDGDTIHVLLPGIDQPTFQDTVRLYGINTPESRPRPGDPAKDFKPQPFALEATNYLAKLCPPGTDVGLVTHERDRYGRLLAVIILPDGRDVNKLLIEAGLAKAYFVKTSKKDPLRLEYEAAQLKAQNSKLRIWSIGPAD